ncbi:hypothetical protein [Cupriavidus pinatubonensis]|uniref:hypothetical protein n=1 Tax=Cupriavidus pinatubonensis TaxID=248026 RepID=UPI0011266780|nr:hypothetical protein [Cupriavidus pinatubonensis]TPQ37085.1 hypothetical protein C2U69_17230 [Cupriavidus pinatubonensis]
MSKQGSRKFRQAAIGAALSECNYAQRALDMFMAYSLIPGIVGPYRASLLFWNGTRYYYVRGWDTSGHGRLLEVFQVNVFGDLEPMLSFQYPPPFRELFPQDYALLFSDEPCGEG